MPVLRKSLVVQGMIIVCVSLLAAPLPPNAQELYFPELVFRPHSKELNAILVDQSTQRLQSLQAPSPLGHSPRRTGTTIRDRVLWLGQRDHGSDLRPWQPRPPPDPFLPYVRPA